MNGHNNNIKNTNLNFLLESDFPTPALLEKKQKEYTQQGVLVDLDENQRPVPYPTPSAKKDVFNLKKYEDLDRHAAQV